MNSLQKAQSYMSFLVDIHNKDNKNLINMYTEEELEKILQYYNRIKLSREKAHFIAESALETRCRTHLNIILPEGVIPCFSFKLMDKIIIP